MKYNREGRGKTVAGRGAEGEKIDGGEGQGKTVTGRGAEGKLSDRDRHRW